MAAKSDLRALWQGDTKMTGGGEAARIVSGDLGISEAMSCWV
jgi:hypothetical protein